MRPQMRVVFQIQSKRQPRLPPISQTPVDRPAMNKSSIRFYEYASGNVLRTGALIAFISRVQPASRQNRATLACLPR
jgi:hypothetical protein